MVYSLVSIPQTTTMQLKDKNIHFDLIDKLISILARKTIKNYSNKSLNNSFIDKLNL